MLTLDSGPRRLGPSGLIELRTWRGSKGGFGEWCTSIDLREMEQFLSCWELMQSLRSAEQPQMSADDLISVRSSEDKLLSELNPG